MIWSRVGVEIGGTSGKPEPAVQWVINQLPVTSPGALLIQRTVNYRMGSMQVFLRMIPHRLLYFLFGINITLLLLLGVSFLFMPAGSDSLVVATLTIVPIVTMLLITVGLIYIKSTYQ